MEAAPHRAAEPRIYEIIKARLGICGCDKAGQIAGVLLRGLGWFENGVNVLTNHTRQGNWWELEGLGWGAGQGWTETGSNTGYWMSLIWVSGGYNNRYHQINVLFRYANVALSNLKWTDLHIFLEPNPNGDKSPSRDSPPE